MQKNGWLNGVLFGLVLAVLAALAYAAACQVPDVEVGVDDANIFYVYARNLNQGHGFVWNTGGERVEGFSSLLWVLLLAPFFGGEAARASLLVPVFNLLLIALALWKLAHSMTRRHPGPDGDACTLASPMLLLLLTLWVALTPRYLVWTVLSGMETGLWSVLLMLATALTLEAAHAGKTEWRGVFGLAVLMPLIVTTRPEGMLWCAVFCGLLFAGKLLGGASFLTALRRAAVPAAAYLVAMGGLFLFRWMYFSSLFPNTYYAKVSPDRRYTLEAGYAYFLAFMRSSQVGRLFILLVPVALVVGGVFVLCRLWACWRRPAASPAACRDGAGGVLIAGGVVFIGLLVPVLVGGDHFEWFRFYQPVWPLLPVPAYFLGRLILSTGCRRLPGQRYWHYIRAGLVAALALAGLAAVDREGWRGIGKARMVQEFVLAREGRELGALLTEVHADLPSVGSIAVGGVQYAYRGPVIDLMGLNNVEMARHPGDRRGIKNHAAFSAEVFYRQLPEIVVPIIMRPEAELDADGWRRALAFYVNHRWILLPLRNLPREARFQQTYVLSVVRQQTRPGHWVAGYYRRDYIERVRRAGLHEVFVLPLDGGD